MTIESRKEEFAQKIYPVLVSLAGQGKTIGYDDLARMVNGLNRFTVAHPLKVIESCCIDSKLPALTALVIRADTGLPGDGFDFDYIGGKGKWQNAVNDVWAYDWSSVNPNF